MDLDDIAPPPKKAKAYELGQDLSQALGRRASALVETLKAEIARVEHHHGAKQSSKSAADVGVQTLRRFRHAA